MRKSSADPWGKGFPGRGHSKGMLLKQEHSWVLEESREASGVEKGEEVRERLQEGETVM